MITNLRMDLFEALVTTCHVSHVSTYPMVAGAGHRSGHAEKLQLWRILWLAGSLCHALLSRVPRVGSRSRVTCHVSPWRGWGSITVTRSAPRWLLLAHVWSLVARCWSAQWSVVTAPGLTGGEAGTGQLSVSSAPLRRWCWLLV